MDKFNEILTDRGLKLLYYFDHTLYDDFLHDTPALEEQYAYYREIPFIDHFPNIRDNVFKRTTNEMSYMLCTTSVIIRRTTGTA